MSDRELLELAAKAVGLNALDYTEGEGMQLVGVSKPWNPLADDGDALRLAADLQMQIDINFGGAYWHVWACVPERLAGSSFSHKCRYTATRFAIVREASIVQQAQQPE